MKHRFFILAALLLFLLTGCSKPNYGVLPDDEPPSADAELQYQESPSEYEVVNDLEGVALELLRVSSEEASFVFVNNSELTVYAYGAYDVEKLIDGTWRAFSYAPSGFGPGPTPSCYFEVAPGDRSDTKHHEESVSFAYYYSDSSGKLESGTYRIIKPVYVKIEQENGKFTQGWHYLAAEFTVE